MKPFISPRFRINKIGDPILREKCELVQEDEFDGTELFQLVKRMEKAAKINEGVGVAAPQVGVNKRVFTWAHRSIGYGHIINPVVEDEKGKILVSEGCLSIPGMFFDIERPSTLVLSGVDILGEPLVLPANRLFARLVLHEMDHLNGILMTDRLTEEQWGEFKREWEKRTGSPCPSDWRQEVGDRGI